MEVIKKMENEEKCLLDIDLKAFNQTSLRLKETKITLIRDSEIKELVDKDGIFLEILLKTIDDMTQNETYFDGNRREHLWLEHLEKIDDTTFKLHYGS